MDDSIADWQFVTVWISLSLDMLSDSSIQSCLKIGVQSLDLWKSFDSDGTRRQSVTEVYLLTWVPVDVFVANSKLKPEYLV